MLFERIKKLSEERGKTIKDVAIELGFGENYFYRWKKQSPSSAYLDQVANYFNVSTDYLLGRTDYKNLEMDVKRYENFDKLSNQDVAKELNFLLEQLGSENYGLLFDGNQIDEETRELLISSLKNTYNIAQSLINKNN